MHEKRLLVSGWGVSLAVHAMAVAIALLFVAQVKPVLNEEIFVWDVTDVTMVQAINPEASVAEPDPVMKPPHVAARVTAPRVEPVPETVIPHVAPQQTVQMIHPVIEAAQPVEQKPESMPQSKVEPVEHKVEVVQQQVKPIEQKVETPQPKVAPVVHAAVEAKEESEPVIHATPLIPQNRPVTAATSEATLEPRSAQHESVIHEKAVANLSEVAAVPAPALAEAPRAAEVAPASATALPAAPVAETPMPAAKTPTGPERKADHRWLAESLWRRVAELKRYPSSARVDGVEGKVVLKAVIRSDGHLAEVSVQKSSGHAVLDEAAMEVVRLATPLTMTQPLQRPEIVVNLPIVYSLAH